MGFLIIFGALDTSGESMDVAANPNWTNTVKMTYTSAEDYFLSTETTRSLFHELHGGRDAAANDADLPDLAVSPLTQRMIDLIKDLATPYPEVDEQFRRALQAALDTGIEPLYSRIS